MNFSKQIKDESNQSREMFMDAVAKTLRSDFGDILYDPTSLSEATGTATESAVAAVDAFVGGDGGGAIMEILKHRIDKNGKMVHTALYDKELKSQKKPHITDKSLERAYIARHNAVMRIFNKKKNKETHQ